MSVRSIRVFTMIMAIIFMLALITGCGGTKNSPMKDNSTNEVAVQSEESGVKEESAQENVTITYMNMWVREEMHGFTYPLDLVDKYVKDHPNVTIKLDSTSHDSYLNTKFKTLAAANQLPELFQINSSDMLSCSNNNMLMDWTDILNADPEWKDSFLPGVFSETTFNGKVTAIPYQFITNEAVYYNADLVKEAGYDQFPTTWEDYMSLCEKLKGMDIIPIALGDKAGWPLCSNGMEILCEFLCGPQWVKDIGTFTGKACYDSPDFVNVLKTIKNAVDKGYFNMDMVSIDNTTEDKSYFYNRKAATIWGGSYTLQGLITDCPEDLVPSVKVAAFPRPANSKPETNPGIFTGGSGWEYACNSRITDAQKKVCTDLVKILTGSEYAKYDVESIKIPVVKMELVTGWDASKVPQLQQDLNLLISKAPLIQLMNQEQSGPAMCDAIYKKLQEMIVGTVTPEKAAKDIQATYENVLASMKN